MTKLSTKGVKATASTIPKEIQPGNHSCKINSVSLDDVTFKVGGKQVVLYMETTPIGGEFEGFSLDKGNPESGKYKGQVGRVKAGEWPYADGVTKTGVVINRDVEILKFIKTLCDAVGKPKWLDSQDDKHDTIESLLEAFNKEKPFENVFLNFCIGGKEYKNRQGYPTYDLFLPKFTRKGVPFEALDVKTSKLVVFDPLEHLKKNKTKEVETFETPGSDIPASASTKEGFDI